jgi:malate dehydrogenase (oxaloacetate-decarboxylating)(NADP+)
MPVLVVRTLRVNPLLMLVLVGTLSGVNPFQCLPIAFNVGTATASLLADPQYLGLKQPRPVGAEYDSFMDEFVAALKTWQPHMLLQFEDFGNTNAFRYMLSS